MISSPDRVFCDYLSVTYAPDNVPDLEVGRLFLDSGMSPTPAVRPGVVGYSFGGSVATVRKSGHWAKIEAPGQVLAHLRAQRQFLDYLSLLSESPHRVTRLDAALDVAEDFPQVRRRLHAQYPGMMANLGRKVVKCSELVGPRADGQISGTYYVGRRGSTQTLLRVYDKMKEAADKRGQVLAATTRYEVEVGRKMGATLRDAAEPASLFYHVASPGFLERPPGVPPWESRAVGGWDHERTSCTPYERLKRFVGTSADLDTMLRLAEDLGPHGLETLARLIQRRLGLGSPPH